MKLQYVKILSEVEIVREGFASTKIFCIVKGKVVLTRKQKGKPRFLGILSEGDVIGLESIYAETDLTYTAISKTACELVQIPKSQLIVQPHEVPSPLSLWIRKRVLNYHHTLQQGMTLVKLYSLCSTLFNLMRLMDSEHSADVNSLKVNLKNVVEELGKLLFEASSIIRQGLNLLSEVGLIDIHEGDAFHQNITIPNQRLFSAYLKWLQFTGDLPAGMYKNDNPVPVVQLSPEAEHLVDGMLLDATLTNKVFIPERAMIHLDHESLMRLYQGGGGQGTFPPDHPAILELENRNVVMRIRDNQVPTVFVNMRDILRMNLLRDPETNFMDISEYLCDELVATR